MASACYLDIFRIFSSFFARKITADNEKKIFNPSRNCRRHKKSFSFRMCVGYYQEKIFVTSQELILCFGKIPPRHCHTKWKKAESLLIAKKSKWLAVNHLDESAAFNWVLMSFWCLNLTAKSYSMYWNYWVIFVINQEN